MAFKVGEKYECIKELSPYFKKGKRYKVTNVEGVEVAFINEHKQQHRWSKDSAEVYFIESISSKDRIATLEKEVAYTKEQLETLRGDYLKDIELLQERFQKKIASLEQTLASFTEFRQSVEPEEPIRQDVQRQTICCSAATQIHGERASAAWYEESVELPIVKVSVSKEFVERVKECSHGGKTLYGALDTYHNFYGFVDAEEQILFAKVFAGDSYVPTSD